MTTYQVNVTRDGKFWLIEVPTIERFTQARKFGEIHEMAQDLIEIMTGVGSESITLEVHVELPDDVQSHLDRSQTLRAQAAQAQGEAAREMHTAARTLRDTGLSMREIGQVLGISYQRAHQLVSQTPQAV